MDRKKSKGISLRVGLTAAFIGIVVFTAVTLSMTALVTLQRNMRTDLRSRVHDYIATASLMVSGDLHKAIVTPEDETKKNYLLLKKTLQDIRDKGVGVRYVYTMRRDAAGSYLFVVDAEESADKMSHVGDEYAAADVTTMMKESFDHPGVKVESDFSKDEWGTWLSGFAPVYDSEGNMECIIGADVSAEYVQKTERHAVIMMGLLILCVTLIAGILGALLARGVTLPLRALADDMARIKSFDLELNRRKSSVFTEIIMMNDSFDSMRSGLRSFKRYVPAELVRKLVTMGNEAKLGGDKRELSIFFSDIRDFTAISEKLHPDKLSYSLEKYLALISGLIEKHTGTVDKYIGDAVMAFWGAPIEVNDHAMSACEAALKIRKELLVLNDQLQSEGLSRLETRIGINTGAALVGNFGYSDRMNYTVLGDSVNLASRLEGLNKYFGTDILISEHTESEVKDRLECRLIDHVAVKGSKTGTKIYALLCHRSESTDETRFLASESQAAFDHYAGRNWAEAKAGYARILERFPQDHTSRIFMDRCDRLEKTAIPPGWKGVTILNEK